MVVIREFKLSYSLNGADCHKFTMGLPLGFQPLRFEYQGDGLALWALVDDTQDKFPQSFLVFKSEIDLKTLFNEETHFYGGTVIVNAVAWHIFMSATEAQKRDAFNQQQAYAQQQQQEQSQIRLIQPAGSIPKKTS